MSADRLVIVDGDCDTAEIADYEATRRDAMRRGLIAGGAVLAAGTVPMLLRVSNAFAQSDGDVGIIEGAVAIEQEAVAAYDFAFKSGVLSEPITQAARLFRDQEQEHANALTAALEDLGGEAPEPPEPADVQGLTELRSEQDVLAFAIELENAGVMAYIDAMSTLQSPGLLKTGAQIMANEGQHLVVLRLAMGVSPAASVPSAFEAGTDGPPTT